jgi:uncharacterized membrane protein
MLEFLRSTPAQGTIWVTVLIAICVAGVYVVKRFRERADSGEPTASDLLTEFREMREGGEITPQEFRQIKSVLGTKLQQSLGSKDTEGDG